MSEVVVIGLASLYLWYLLAEALITGWLFGWARDKFPLLVGCPWCAGFWITGIVTWLATDYDPLTHLAAAGLVGFMGRFAT